jgi:D-alanyl-D-alanine dipeptidase
VIEGYRPLSLQERYFTTHVNQLRARWPDAEPATLHAMASRYISPPDVAPHVAGAAVDLTLRTVDGAELWMGTEVNDTDLPTCHTAFADGDARVRERRAILGSALAAVEFVNYPTEWWHWSYGDRYWACVTGAAHARYGPIG